MPRTKFRDEPYETISIVTGLASSGSARKSYITDENNRSKRPIASPVLHVKVKKSYTGYNKAGTVFYKNHGDVTMLHPFKDYVEENLGDFIQPPKLEFQDNNDFGIIQFLTELDDTLAMFSGSFIKSLFTRDGFGAYSWGVIPFVNDLKALASMVSDLTGGIDREKVRRVSVAANVPMTYLSAVQGTVSGTVRMTGAMMLPPLTLGDKLAILLDEIGAHPDLGTVWDLIPLSFAVNYFIPVGQTLEALHPRGWFKPEIMFDGTLSYSLYCSKRYPDPDGSSGRVTGTIYRRMPYNYSFGPRKPQPKVKWKAPNLEQLFSAAYLYMQQRS